MWVAHALTALGSLEDAATEADAFAVLRSYASKLGADLVSYHYRPPPLPGTEPDTEVLANGYPDAWVGRYRAERLHRIDPITAYAATQTRPVRWSEVAARLPSLTDAQRRYLHDLRDWLGEGDGLAVPAFGPSGQHGYLGLGHNSASNDHDLWDPVRLRLVQGVCEAFHLRFCELRIARLPPPEVELSERETDILRLLGSGRADWLIGGVVGLSEEGVRGRIRALMEGFGVSDRPSLVLRARALGLIDSQLESAPSGV